MSTKKLFPLGSLITTMGVNSEMQTNEKFFLFLNTSLEKHKSGDWGDLESEDRASNDAAIDHEDRIFSSYLLPEDIKVSGNTKVWIITEWDRSVTTLLFPSEY